MGAVAWSSRQRSVSHPHSSNRTCPIKASFSPTGFTVRHTGSKPTARALRHGDQLSFAPQHTSLGRRLSLMVFAGSSPITSTSSSSNAHQKSGPFASLVLPSLNAPTTLSDSRHGRRLKATLRPLPSPATGLPRLPEPPFRRAMPTTPADRAGALVDCFPAHAAFPKWPEVRHPHCHFRACSGFTHVTARRLLAA